MLLIASINPKLGIVLVKLAEISKLRKKLNYMRLNESLMCSKNISMYHINTSTSMKIWKHYL